MQTNLNKVHTATDTACPVCRTNRNRTVKANVRICRFCQAVYRTVKPKTRKPKKVKVSWNLSKFKKPKKRNRK